MTYGIKIAKPGKSVHSTDMRDLSVDMNTFSMFKLHSTQSTTVTLNAEDSEASTTISHGLGYVPAFLVYYKRSDESVERLLPDIPFGVGFDFYPWAYATNTGVTVGYAYSTPYNRQTLPVTEMRNTYWGDGDFFLGNLSGTGYSSGARFGSVPVTSGDTVTRAKIYLYAGNAGGSGTIRWDNYGVDEDNTSSFGDPFGRPMTTATHNQTRSVPSLGDTVEVDVINEMNEIRGRAGWSSGNAMGFVFVENSSDTGSYFIDSSPLGSYMELTLSGSLTISFRVIIFKDKIAD